MVDALIGTPFDRSFQIDALRVSGQPIKCTYGPYNYQVVVEEFKPSPKQNNWIPYSIKLIVASDNSQSGVASGAPIPGVAPTPTNNAPTQLAKLQQVASSPASGKLLPASASNLVQKFQQAAQTALNQANGNPANIAAATLTALHQQATSAINALQSLTASTDPGTASTAADTLSQVQLLDQSLNSTTSENIFRIPVVNPNLMELAAQYYGDAKLWRYIAKANNLIDQFPVGTFQLIIPGKAQVLAAQKSIA
jgi:hypothetical protein